MVNMKRLILTAVATLAISPAFASNIGVSVSVGQPGFYGQIDIGDYPQPQLIYPQPVYLERGGMERPPIYMRVPPGHAKHWGKHCREYNACGERVYFVQDNWYHREFVPRYQERHGEHHGDRRDNRREERRDDNRGDNRNDNEGNNGHQGRNR